MAVTGCGCVLALCARAQNVTVVLICGVAMLAFLFIDRATITRRWFVTTIGVVGIIGVACLVTAGPFYLRNYRLYGDLTGSRAVTALAGLKPRGDTLLEDLLRPGTWLTMIVNQPYWVGHTNSSPQAGPLWPAYLCLALMALGLAIFALRGRLRTPAPHGNARLVMVRRLLAALVILQVAEAASHVAGGGNLHARYLFGAIGAVAAAEAVGLLTLPFGGRGLFVIAVALIQLVVSLLYFGFLATSRNGASRGPDVGALAQIQIGLRNNGMPAPVLASWALTVTAMLLLAVAGVAMWLAAGSVGGHRAEDGAPAGRDRAPAAVRLRERGPALGAAGSYR